MVDQAQFSQEVRETLHKDRFFSSTHHYFFEVKVANNGSHYIVIDQKRKIENDWAGAKLRIFEAGQY